MGNVFAPGQHVDDRKRKLAATLQNGSVSMQPLALPDLLMHYLLNVAPGSETAARRRVDLELEALRKG